MKLNSYFISLNTRKDLTIRNVFLKIILVFWLIVNEFGIFGTNYIIITHFVIVGDFPIITKDVIVSIIIIVYMKTPANIQTPASSATANISATANKDGDSVRCSLLVMKLG